MKKLLCIFTVFFAVPKSSQEKPEVTMHPEFKQVYSGDTVLLKCSGAGSVTWWRNDTHIHSNEQWYIPAISTAESGSYRCKRDEGESETKIITVLEGLPIATLSIKSGQPVIAKGDSVVMELHVHSGLEGWYCKVYKGGRVRRIVMLKSLMTRSNTYVQFQPKALNDTENPALYWCEHKTDNERSNPISIRITDLMVMLESYPDRAIAGKELMLKCYVWGDPIISHAVFYKDNQKIYDGTSSTYIIEVVKSDHKGSYSCEATYKFRKNTSGIENKVSSEAQELLVQGALPEAKLTLSDSKLSCSCTNCPTIEGFLWYQKDKHGHFRKCDEPSEKQSGSFRCRAKWTHGVSMLSNAIELEDESTTNGPGLVIAICVVAILIGILCIVLVLCRRRRAGQTQVYEEVEQGQRQKRAADTNIMMQETKEGVKGGDGGYEALQKSKADDKEGLYHTLGAEGGKGEGGYEALKRSKVDEKEGEYQTLGAEGGKGGEGGYEALKRSKVDEKEGEYQTLGAEGGKGGEGGYEALKRSKVDEKEGEYQTLGTEGGKSGV